MAEMTPHADFNIQFQNNSSDVTIYVNGGSGTWSWVNWGPAFGKPYQIPPGQAYHGDLQWSGKEHSAEAGYAFGTTATAQEATNICFIEFILDTQVPGSEVPITHYTKNAWTGGYTWVRLSDQKCPAGYHIGITNGSGVDANQLQVRLDPDNPK